MMCSLCRYWLRDTSFPGGVGYCYLKGAVVKASDVCELFKKREEETVAVKVISY